MNAAQWQQEIVKPAVELIPSSTPCNISKANKRVDSSDGGAEKKGAGTVARPPKEQPLPCPRCNSTNTKFCYYNNYSLTQPRYFCKGCRRYWTEGGSLRNIPVGGCSRKNKRLSSSPAGSLPGVGTKKPFVLPQLQNPNSMIHLPERVSQGLNLTFPANHQDYKSISDFVHVSNRSSQTSTIATAKSHHSALELFTGMTYSGVGGGFSNGFMPISDPDSVYGSARFSDLMHDFKSPTLDFSLEYGLGTRQSSIGVLGTTTDQNDQISTGGGRRVLVFPFDNLIHQQDCHDYEQIKADQNRGRGVPKGYWTEMLGDGGHSDW